MVGKEELFALYQRVVQDNASLREMIFSLLAQLDMTNNEIAALKEEIAKFRKESVSVITKTVPNISVKIKNIDDFEKWRDVVITECFRVINRTISENTNKAVACDLSGSDFLIVTKNLTADEMTRLKTTLQHVLNDRNVKDTSTNWTIGKVQVNVSDSTEAA